MENVVESVGEVDELEVDHVHQSAKENQHRCRLIHCDQHEVHNDLSVSEGA